jgi:hypothetical protein
MKTLLTTILIASLSFNVFADNKPTAAQLDTTPPPADGALTPDQTPPFIMPTPAVDAPIGKTAEADEPTTEEQLN